MKQSSAGVVGAVTGLMALGFSVALGYIFITNIGAVGQAAKVPASAYVDALSVVTGQAGAAPRVA